MELRTNNHSVFAIYFHLILVVKYRRKVINNEISERLKGIFRSIEGNYNITLEEWNHDLDHVHILLSKRSEIKTGCYARENRRVFPMKKPPCYN